MTLGFPIVRVPVLSKATTFTECVISSASASLIKIPFLAPRPVPTIIDVGVARPKAHGHAMTRTAMPLIMACSQLPVAKPQPKIVRSAITTTTGTKTALTRSTKR
ncbi:hypothetical protein D3C87_1615660 [compost metagenome]